MNVGGAIGWWLGGYVGLLTAFALSSVGALAGVYGGWWVARNYLE